MEAFTLVSAEDPMEESMAVFTEVFQGLRVVVDLHLVAWERRLVEDTGICDGIIMINAFMFGVSSG